MYTLSKGTNSPLADRRWKNEKESDSNRLLFGEWSDDEEYIVEQQSDTDGEQSKNDLEDELLMVNTNLY